LGLLRRLRRRLGQGIGPPGKGSSQGPNQARQNFFSTLAAQVEGEAEPAVLMLLQDLDSYFEAWREILASAFLTDDEIIEGSFRLRVTDKELSSESWKLTLADKVQDFIEEAQTVIKALLHLAHDIEEGLLEKRLPEDFFVAWIGEFKAAISRLRAQIDFIGRFFLKMKADPGTIAWVEAVAGRRRNFKLVMAPLEVGSLLEEMLYQRLKTMIMVSATIAVERSFDFFMARVGLDERRRNGTLHSLILTSPFDYRRNALTMVPRDLPLPNESGYIHALSLFLDTLIARIGGRSLVLFTSYRAMKQAAATCRDSLQRRGVKLLLQGEGQRQWLLNELKNNYNTALFATDSLWRLGVMK